MISKRCAGMSLHRSPRPVCREFKWSGQVLESIKPIRFNFGVLSGFTDDGLRAGILAETNCGRQLRRNASDLCRVELSQIVNDNVDRPAITNEMMRCDHQYMVFIAKPHKLCAKKRPLSQIKCRSCIRREDATKFQIARVRLKFR